MLPMSLSEVGMLQRTGIGVVVTLSGVLLFTSLFFVLPRFEGFTGRHTAFTLMAIAWVLIATSIMLLLLPRRR